MNIITLLPYTEPSFNTTDIDDYHLYFAYPFKIVIASCLRAYGCGCMSQYLLIISLTGVPAGNVSSALIAVVITLLMSCSVITSMCSRSSCTGVFLAGGGGFAVGVLAGVGDILGVAAGV